MLITALVLTLIGVFRRKFRGGAEATERSTLTRFRAAVRHGATRLIREPLPALSAAVAVLGMAVVGTHLACSGQV